MFMVCGIGPDDLVADAAAFDPSMMFTTCPLSFLSCHLDEFIGTLFFFQVPLLSALSVYFSDLIWHILRHSCPSNPSVVAGMKTYSATIYPEETSDPENFPAAVFIPLSRLLDLRGI